MYKAHCQTRSGGGHLAAEMESFDPPLVTRENYYGPRDYLRPVAGGVVYALICSSVVGLPLLLTASFWGALIALGVAAVLVIEMAFIMALSTFIHHQVFVHRLRKYGPSFYSSELLIDSPPAEAFELCLAATSDLPKSKVVGMDEHNGSIKVSMKGNFWITVDRQVTFRVKAADGGKSTVMIDPSIKLTPFRRKLIRMIWGDKWYPLVFRSDVNWNRKIINTINEYIASVPNWDHRHDPHALLESAFRGEGTSIDLHERNSDEPHEGKGDESPERNGDESRQDTGLRSDAA